MTTMSDEGERACPLCMEEMDLTDQQLKPCKCGYEICVWCWHHIIEMAEKEGTEGRCPACRSSYDKQRIVGMATNCERMVAEINGDRKQKSQKSKPKASAEARKHLSSVRVIQRNLVYIIGLPSNLADESMLDHRDYFGQYGKVLKVSISRPAGGTQQASNSNTFSVYITYAKEEEAVRCIQAVHNFVLDGKPLRACFGTTKYCHAWLRNMPCSNPECFYLHDIGSQEDSFSKDEIISAYTRSRVPQITSNNLQRRSGNMLPPPIDDFCANETTSPKLMIKTSNSSASNGKFSPPNGAGLRSTVLPAAASWGSRTSYPTSSTSCLQGPSKQIQPVVPGVNQTSAWHDLVKQGKLPENHTDVMELSSTPSEPSKVCADRHSHTAMSSSSDEFGCARQISAWHDGLITESKSLKEGHATILNGRPRSSEASQSYIGGDYQTDTDHVTSAWDDDDDVITVPSISKRNDEVPLNGRFISVESTKSGISNGPNVSDLSTDVLVTICASGSAVSNTSSPLASDGTYEDIDPHQDKTSFSDVLCTKEADISSNGFHDSLIQSGATANGSILSLCTDISSVNLNACSTVSSPGMDEQYSPPNPILAELPKSNKQFSGNYSESLASMPLNESAVWISDLWKRASVPNGDVTSDFLKDSDERHKSSDVEQASFPDSVHSPFFQNPSMVKWDDKHDNSGPSGYTRTMNTSSVSSQPLINYNVKFPSGQQQGNFDCQSKSEVACKYTRKSACKEKERLPNFSKINRVSGVNTRENNIISDILSMDFNPWDDFLTEDSTQSRFSFARQENESSFLKQFSSETEIQQIKGNDLAGGSHNGPMPRCIESTSLYSPFQPATSSDKNSAPSRSKVSAPPGFSAPNRAPPPGFSSQGRSHQAHDAIPTGFSLAQKKYQVSLPETTGDVEHIDPAILAFQKGGHMPSGINTSLGLRSFPSEIINASENDLRFQLLMQQPISTHQVQLMSGQIGDDFLPMNGTYYPDQFTGPNYSSLSRFAQMPSQTSTNSFISNNNWNGWSDVQSRNGLDMMEMLNERHAINKYFPASEERTFHISRSGDVYNRSFGI